MTIILTEKSSAAQSFAEALGAEKRGGYYEASGYLITWCVGHLYELAEPETYRPEAEKWSLETLPIIPERFLYRVIRKTADRTEFVTSLLKKYSGEKIIIATDADREGELIAREVIGMA